jgi:hypothetical protein
MSPIKRKARRKPPPPPTPPPRRRPLGAAVTAAVRELRSTNRRREHDEEPGAPSPSQSRRSIPRTDPLPLVGGVRAVGGPPELSDSSRDAGTKHPERSEPGPANART